MGNNKHKLNMIIDNIEKVIVGKKETIEIVLMALLCRSHVLIEDIPGVGKTSLAGALSKSIDCNFNRIQFTPDILPSDITGFSIYNQHTKSFEYQDGAVMSNIVLADEINRTSPKTQSSLLEVMAENQITVDGKTRRLPRPFMVIATQNPIEYLGTFPLPEAQLDRFFVKVKLGYPSMVQECEMLAVYYDKNPLEHLKPVVKAEDVGSMQEEVAKIYVSDYIIGYIVTIVNETRIHELVQLGASPRSSIALMQASKAWAYYSGRDYVLPDDVKKMAPSVLSHRIKPKQEAISGNVTAEIIIDQILASAAVPRGKDD